MDRANFAKDEISFANIWGVCDGDLLAMAGEHDAKFAVLAERLVDAIPDSSLIVILGSGHSVHLEQPAATAMALARVLF